MFFGLHGWGGPEALWNLMKEKDLLTLDPLAARQAREASQEAQAASLAPKMQAMYEARPAYAAAPVNEALKREQDMHRFRRAAAPLPQDVQAKLKTGGYDPVVDEDDEMQKLLRYMFMSELMAGMAGGDPPTPYTVQAGPAARAFPTMPSMMG
jgi:hypothetical protein